MLGDGIRKPHYVEESSVKSMMVLSLAPVYFVLMLL